jgi:hypothetical protein
MAKAAFNNGVFFGSPALPGDSSTVITVTNVSGGSDTLWEDRDGVTEMDNPFNLTSNGNILFYADPGRYEITASRGSQSHTWYDFVLVDGASAGGGEFKGETTLRTTSYTLSPELHGVIRETSGDLVVTVPAESTLDLSLTEDRAFSHTINHRGGGTVTISAGTVDVVLVPPYNGVASVSNEGQRITLLKSTVTANRWDILGQTDSL